MHLLRSVYEYWIRHQPPTRQHTNLASLTYTMKRQQVAIDGLAVRVNATRTRVTNDPYRVYVDRNGDVR